MKVARLPDGSPEIFHTLQGEGPSLGAPAIFLRLSLCNLHCQWCDTPYTWNWENTPWKHQDQEKYVQAEQIVDLSPEQLAPLIARYQCERLILTGGEPLLQQKELVGLAGLLPDHLSIEVETNGTQIPGEDFISIPSQFNVSPKLSNSGMDEKLRLQPTALSLFSSLPKAIFKFVVCTQTDLDEVRELQVRYSIPSSRLFLMPEGRDRKSLQERSLWLAEICRDNGFRFSPRLHVLLWGNERAR
jgi:organic radical activating enzyme